MHVQVSSRGDRGSRITMTTLYFPGLRGLTLTALAQNWGLRRRLYEQLPVVGDWLFHHRFSSHLRARLSTARFLGAGKAGSP
jgi:hypothetical protein